MTIAVGFFELFTYAIPGSLYLTLFTYVAARAQWIDLVAVMRTPSVLLIIGLVLVSYLLGYLAYPVGDFAHKLVPNRRDERAAETFLRRNPAAKDREYVRADPFLLLTGIQVNDNELASDVNRSRATGLMLRNCAPPLLFAAIIAIVELFTGRSPGLAVTCAVIFFVGFVGLIVQGRKLARWAHLRTLEVAFWLPDIDEKFRNRDS
nr:hypothetical protein [Kibdelosporangium sp. MJ126-NF4]CEL20318.1 hypothetical protein [Kibdelosporangium sp. MJ126-NF4]CTQ97544.1 hypothetical protein [Kibdelosporangium sp. MJ126-NF4]